MPEQTTEPISVPKKGKKRIAALCASVLTWTVLAGMLLSACAAKRELTDLALVTALGIDEKDGKIVVYLQVVNPTGGMQSGQMGGMSGGSVYTFETTGTTFVDALAKADNLVSRQLFYPHLFFIVLGEKFARKRGLDSIVDLLERSNELRGTYLFFVAKGTTAGSILKVYTPIEKNPGMALRDSVMISGSSYGQQVIGVKDVIRWRYGENRDPVLHGVEPGTTPEEAKTTKELEHIDANRDAFRLTGLALFRESRLLDWMTLDESLGWTLMSDRYKGSMLLRIPNERQHSSFGILLRNVRTKLTPELKGEHLSYRVKVKGEAILKEINFDAKVEDERTIQQLQQLTERFLEEKMLQAVVKAKKHRIDNFGFGDALYRKKPREWEKRKKNWRKDLPALKVKVSAHIQIMTTGMRSESVHERKK
ncbi:Ger(x)C family spore germination protein [Numidum massiliense]|uniref:Ger(x)C family spore germination protein n=1 Tax=Numidum massiliense TaxID=1522315 RepID=UPI001E4120F7|nr:Ger(x)C family spore germination protein [Numidum massiliense]